MGKELPTGTLTFLFTDIEGSTQLLHELGPSAYADALGAHRQVIRGACLRYAGIEIDTQGDAFFFVFETSADALAAAAEMTEGLSSGPIRVRVGVHTGTALLANGDYVGVDIHRAARIAASGHGGQVLVSQATAALVGDDLRDLGQHRFKDLLAPEHVYQLGTSDFPPIRSLERTNLPVAAWPLLGRERELGEIRNLVGTGVKLVTLTGPGGSGKTRLALQAASELSDRFPDGTFFVPLASLREAQAIPAAVAKAVALAADEDVVAWLATMKVLPTSRSSLPVCCAADRRAENPARAMARCKNRASAKGQVGVRPSAPLGTCSMSDWRSGANAGLPSSWRGSQARGPPKSRGFRAPIRDDPGGKGGALSHGRSAPPLAKIRNSVCGWYSLGKRRGGARAGRDPQMRGVTARLPSETSPWPRRNRPFGLFAAQK
jgi:class 3 adenylate cyclase